MEVPPASDLLFHHVFPVLRVTRVKILFLYREALGLRSPEVEHRSDHIKGIPYADDHFVCCKGYLFSERVVRLDEPTLIINLTLTAEATMLKAVMQTEVQITV